MQSPIEAQIARPDNPLGACEALLPKSWRAHIDFAPRKWRLFGQIVAFGVPMLVYLGTVIPLGFRHKEKLNTDAICYIRRAMYLSNGDFYHAISGYWSPLISWLIAPCLKLGFDGLYTAHAVVWAWGAILIVAFGIFLYTVSNFGHVFNMLAMLAVALFMRFEAVREITPDILMAACLLLYLSAMGSRQLLQSRRMQIAAGVLGGISYLAKAYALPFVLVHLPLTYAIRGRIERGAGATRRTVVSMIVSVLAFAVIAGPWVGVISWRYHQFTFSTAGTRAHAVKGKPPGHPHTASVPEDPYIYGFENPESLPYHFWSPLESRELFSQQFQIVKENLAGVGVRKIPGILPTLAEYDWLHVGIIALFASPLLLLPFGQHRGERWITLWLALTIAIYCVGFLPVFFIPRYLNPLVMPLILVLALRFVLCWGGADKAQPLRTVLALVVVGSFCATTVHDKLLDRGSTQKYRLIAKELRRDGITGPLAGSADVHDGPFVAFHMGVKFIDIPSREKIAVLDTRLSRQKNIAVLVWPEIASAGGKPSPARRLVDSPSWRLFKHYEKPEFDVYVPTAPPN